MRAKSVVKQVISSAFSLEAPIPELTDSSTDHLTNFALLLQGANNGGGLWGSNGPCSTYTPTLIFSWLTLGFVASAILIVLVSIVLIEIRFRKETLVRKVRFYQMSKTVSSNISRV